MIINFRGQLLKVDDAFKKVDELTYLVMSPCIYVASEGTSDKVLTCQTEGLPPNHELPEQKVAYLRSLHPNDLLFIKHDSLETDMDTDNRIQMPDGTSRPYCSVRYARLSEPLKIVECICPKDHDGNIIRDAFCPKFHPSDYRSMLDRMDQETVVYRDYQPCICTPGYGINRDCTAAHNEDGKPVALYRFAPIEKVAHK